VQGSLDALPTPAILVFLHSLPLVAALAGLSAWSGVAMSLGPLTLSTLLGAAPTAIISGVQVLIRFTNDAGIRYDLHLDGAEPSEPMQPVRCAHGRPYRAVNLAAWWSSS